MIKKIFILISLSFLLGLFACKTDKQYEGYKTLDPSGWDKDSCAIFSFNIDKTFLNYNLFINVRNRGDYANSNLWLFVDITAPDYTCIHDTIEYQLALPSGKWVGKGTGGIYSNQFPFRENVYFPIEGTYTISIRHAMRNNPLKGISDIGFGVKRR
jgi:gliding motility-associated lipoprotein GldH